MDLVDFLRARLDEDERVAQQASAGPWSYDPGKQWHAPPSALGVSSPGEEYVNGGTADDPLCIAATGPADLPAAMADAQFIARWNPARVLAEVAAKRAILAALALREDQADGPGTLAAVTGSHAVGLRIAVAALAQPYADHPDFDPAWKQ
jgi:uncharacterized protein DUF6221